MSSADSEVAPAALPAARKFIVDGGEVQVFDGLLPDVAPYVEALGKAAFTRTEIARPDTAEHRHWVTQIRLDSLLAQPIYHLTRHAAAGFAPVGHEYVPYRAYTNAATFGDMLYSHTDCLPEQNDLTALWYLNHEWDLEWGGETLFYDAQGEVACAVMPRPGRLVVFSGAIRHVGRPPNRVYYGTRYTMAIKFERRLLAATATGAT